ncbi:MAG: transglutaminase domain-containing protein, partial [Desulfobacterales bacterium]
ANQRCLDLQSNYPYQLLTDDLGNQVLHFTFENLAPYASRIISIKASLLVSRFANPIAAVPMPADMKAQKYIESEHPDIKRLARKLNGSDPSEVIDQILHWVKANVRYSGYSSKDRGALYALKNRKGDCTEYMDLFVALCRANGVPARPVGGYICPENTVLNTKSYHNWAEFYEGGIWHIADPQNHVLRQNQSDYIAMRIIRAPEDNGLEPYYRFRVKGEGLQIRMN